jgi:UDP-sugar pyrophosphorylase
MTSLEEVKCSADDLSIARSSPSVHYIDLSFYHSYTQLADLEASYPGGLPSYLGKAKILLQESADAVNPFDEYTAVVPDGESLSYDGDGTMSFSDAEQAGRDAMPGAVFVLVAGGLGERLGYSGIKLSLETNVCTAKCYLEVYIRYIQAMQYLLRDTSPNVRIPLVIMTSGDTDPLTRKLLKDNDNFGMDADAITIVTQDKVAALRDGAAGLALDEKDRWTVQTKPHGHGDVHQLLFKEGLVDTWEKEGKTHVIFLQDTNALVINSVVPTLGVSVTKGFHMNSICIPRLAGEAAGAIARLEYVGERRKSCGGLERRERLLLCRVSSLVLGVWYLLCETLARKETVRLRANYEYGRLSRVRYSFLFTGIE